MDETNSNGIYNLFTTMTPPKNKLNKIMLSTVGGFVFIRIDDILYCKADDSYTHFYLIGNKRHIASKNLKSFEDLLSTYHFYRIHKSYIVNLNHIDRICKQDGLTAIMSNEDLLPISFRKWDGFINLIKSLMLS